jgi:hypothetical protein
LAALVAVVLSACVRTPATAAAVRTPPDFVAGVRAAVERIVPFLERYVGAGVSAAAGSRGGG